MDEQFYNFQSTAVFIEHILRNHGLASYGDADNIRRDPLGFLDAVLSIYEKQSEEKEIRAADFWEEYKSMEHKSLDDFGKDFSIRFYNGIKELFK